MGSDGEVGNLQGEEGGDALKWTAQNRGPVARQARRQDRGRKFVVRADEMTLKVEESILSLGIEIGEKMHFGPYVERIGVKVMAEYGKLRRLTKANSGLGEVVMMVIYKGMTEPMLLYGAEVWGREMERKEKLKGKWKLLQRRALILATGAYRTISHEAARVIAGVMPIEI